jgi:hypothetical protein
MIDHRSRVALLFALVSIVACHHATAPGRGLVKFQIDAPFCGGTPNSYRFVLDGAVLGTETLKHGESSQSYPAPAGQRSVRALLNGTAVLQDTTVTIRANQTVVDQVGLYCS